MIYKSSMQNNHRTYLSSRVIDLESALKHVRSNQRVVTAMAAAEPFGLFSHLDKHAVDLANLRIYCANPNEDFACFSNHHLAGKLEFVVLFLTSAIRKRQGFNLVHYHPQHLSQWSRNLMAQGPIDIFWGSCSPPDERGFVSLGPSVCYESDMIRHANKVILEINPHMPVTFGSSHVPISTVDYFVEQDRVLPSMNRPQMTDVDHRIASYVADLVENGSTIQLGIGSIPNAVGLALESKKDLGVHTEMINDTMMDLYHKGVVTGMKKSIWPGKIVGSFALGSSDLYHFIRNNPLVEFQPSSVINDPYRIGRNNKMVSINTAVEVDITGQVCSESLGHVQISGVGGASETHIGAQRSPGGRGIIAIHSTAKNESQSKISFELKPGAKVSISRNDIDTVVTEFGVAELKGRSVSERVKALVQIAHPKFRDELLAKSREARYL